MAICYFILSIPFNICFIASLLEPNIISIKGITIENDLFYKLCTFILAFCIDFLFIRSCILTIKPHKHTVFKKYGTVEKLTQILKEIEDNVEYEDKQIIISKNYIADKKNLGKIIEYKDIKDVYKEKRYYRGVHAAYWLTIKDIYYIETRYFYMIKDEDIVNQLVKMIKSKCN